MTKLWSHNPCAAAGAISGGFAGLMITLLQIMHGSVPALTTSSEFGRAIVLLTLTALLIVLFVMGVLLRYGISAIFLPAFVTCFLSVWLTVKLLETINVPQLGVLLGLFLGTVIGLLLCYLFCRREALLGGIRG